MFRLYCKDSCSYVLKVIYFVSVTKKYTFRNFVLLITLCYFIRQQVSVLYKKFGRPKYFIAPPLFFKLTTCSGKIKPFLDELYLS